MLREDIFLNNSHHFNKVIHVGHSLGSFQTYLLANMYPDLTDSVVLTGFSNSPVSVGLFITGSNFQLVNSNQPLHFGNHGAKDGSHGLIAQNLTEDLFQAIPTMSAVFGTSKRTYGLF
jgi:pimeloyl-ACP methyl ester carboxylesterase